MFSSTILYIKKSFLNVSWGLFFFIIEKYMKLYKIVFFENDSNLKFGSFVLNCFAFYLLLTVFLSLSFLALPLLFFLCLSMYWQIMLKTSILCLEAFLSLYFDYIYVSFDKKESEVLNKVENFHDESYKKGVSMAAPLILFTPFL